MVSEDPETYDIHADLVGGWPVLVNPVINHFRSLSYNPVLLPSNILSKLTNDLNKLINKATEDSNKSQSFKLAVGGALPKTKNANTAYIKFGFKAPVAMTIVPALYELQNNLKFLHVLRDGRDISFSANQGPVNKFYNTMYGSIGKTDPITNKAMRLWSDWNVQLNQWAKSIVLDKEKETEIDKDKSKSFGYLALHVEDIVSKDISVKYAAIYQLATWVGSDLTQEQICCVSLSDSSFMGSHDRTDKNKVSEDQVNNRYGKWKTKPKETISKLNNIGKQGLELFGYEPMRLLSTDDMTTINGFKCVKDFDCSAVHLVSNQINIGNIKLVAADWGDLLRTEILLGFDIKGNDLFSIAIDDNLDDKKQCFNRCNEVLSCKAFTVDTRNKICYLKTKSDNRIQSSSTSHLVSGFLI